MDTTIISLDIETYGASKKGVDGNTLPDQKVFHPVRSYHTDRVSSRDLILTASITLVTEDYPCSTKTNLQELPAPGQSKSKMMTCEISPLSSSTLQKPSLNLRNLNPQETMVFNLSVPTDRCRLQSWLRYSTTIIGMNLPFDLQYLRFDPQFRFELEDQTLIDLSILNYLHDETRPERSLKNLGPVLHTHSYQETIKTIGKFENPSDPLLHFYNAQDTHNTVLAVRELARRIYQDFPDTHKLSTFCCQFYSNLLWTIIRMSESGICMDQSILMNLEEQLLQECKEAHEYASSVGLPLEGTGSGKAKENFMEVLCEHIDSNRAVGLFDESIKDHELLQYTPTKGIISFNESNRNLLAGQLHPDDPYQEVLQAAKKHAAAQKVVSSYTYPLLRHRRNHPEDKSSKLLYINGNHVAYPTWYAVPTFAKDANGAAGGTLQGRITCKKPSAQTFPHSIKSTITSQFPHGQILSIDLSQIELRVAALLSGDRALKYAYQEGIDLHSERAKKLFGSEFIDARQSHELRQAAKMVNFADLFRSGAQTMQSQLLAMTGQYFELSFFEDVVRSRPKHRPGLYRFQNNLIKEANAKGRIELPFTGQSRYFMGGEKFAVNEIVNFPIQTTAGNTLLCIQAELDRLLPSINHRKPGIYMFLNIYDAIYFDVDYGEEEQIRSLVLQALNYVEQEGYWAMLKEHYGNEIPLEYDWS